MRDEAAAKAAVQRAVDVYARLDVPVMRGQKGGHVFQVSSIGGA